jgi:hypothetical protein
MPTHRWSAADLREFAGLLATLYDDRGSAEVALWRIDFPTAQVPPPTAPGVFWSQVLGQLGNVVEDGPWALLRQSRTDFPANPALLRLEVRISVSLEVDDPPEKPPGLLPLRRPEGPVRGPDVTAQIRQVSMDQVRWTLSSPYLDRDISVEIFLPGDEARRFADDLIFEVNEAEQSPERLRRLLRVIEGKARSIASVVPAQFSAGECSPSITPHWPSTRWPTSRNWSGRYRSGGR